MRRPGSLAGAAVSSRTAEALELGDGEGFEEGAGAGTGGAGLGLGVGEEEQVGDVFAAAGGLLGEVVGPAEELEQGADEVLLGLGFVGVVGGGEVLEEAAGFITEGDEGGALGLALGVWRMPSVRKYSVKRWPGMGVGGFGDWRVSRVWECLVARVPGVWIDRLTTNESGEGGCPEEAGLKPAPTSGRDSDGGDWPGGVGAGGCGSTRAYARLRPGSPRTGVGGPRKRKF